MSVCELVDKHATKLALKELIARLRGAGKELTALSMDEPITSSAAGRVLTQLLLSRGTCWKAAEPPVQKMNT